MGDRLDTDIAGAARTGVASLLVFTGICDIASALSAEAGERPDYVGADLSALTRPPRPTVGPEGPRLDAGRRRFGDAVAWVDAGALRVECGDDWLAGVQCGCAAAWAEAVTPDVEGAAAHLDELRRTVVP